MRISLYPFGSWIRQINTYRGSSTHFSLIWVAVFLRLYIGRKDMTPVNLLVQLYSFLPVVSGHLSGPSITRNPSSSVEVRRPYLLYKGPKRLHFVVCTRTRQQTVLRRHGLCGQTIQFESLLTDTYFRSPVTVQMVYLNVCRGSRRSFPISVFSFSLEGYSRHTLSDRWTVRSHRSRWQSVYLSLMSTTTVDSPYYRPRPDQLLHFPLLLRTGYNSLC